MPRPERIQTRKPKKPIIIEDDLIKPQQTLSDEEMRDIKEWDDQDNGFYIEDPPQKIYSEETQDMGLEVPKPEQKEAKKPKASVPKSEPLEPRIDLKPTENRQQIDRFLAHASTLFKKVVTRGHYLTLTGRRREIVDLAVREVGEGYLCQFKAKEIEGTLGMRADAVSRDIRLLDRDGFIHCLHGSGKAGHSFLLNPSIFSF